MHFLSSDINMYDLYYCYCLLFFHKNVRSWCLYHQVWDFSNRFKLIFRVQSKLCCQFFMMIIMTLFWMDNTRHLLRWRRTHENFLYSLIHFPLSLHRFRFFAFFFWINKTWEKFNSCRFLELHTCIGRNIRILWIQCTNVLYAL